MMLDRATSRFAGHSENGGYQLARRQPTTFRGHTCRGRIPAALPHSDSDHGDFAARSSDKPFYVVRVARENRRFPAKSSRHHYGIDDIGGSGLAEQASRIVGVVLARGNNGTATQEAPELGLLWRPANLGDYRRWNQRNNAKFQTGFVFGPCPPFVSIGSHENGGVVDNGAHVGRRTVRDVWSCERTARRASSISSALKRPCCSSHWETAARPARRCYASRAATVIQADTLTPSRAAAARISS